jgi:cytochrome c oxidase cbb3-type subunit 3
MIRTATILAVSLVVTSGCVTRNPEDPPVVPPDKIVDFGFLYANNCSGCHGADGNGGVAIGLGDPVYLAIADDAAIRRVTSGGVPGTSMPAFARSSGGMLTDNQIDVIIRGIRTRWAKPDVLRDVRAPSYSAEATGDAKRGADVFVTYCSSCHGADGRGSKQASSVVDGSYLALVSDQYLRTNVIVGRPELGAPDWRNDVPGKPMSSEDVSDVVAWLSAQRSPFPGQPYTSSMRVKGGIR